MSFSRSYSLTVFALVAAGSIACGSSDENSGGLPAVGDVVIRVNASTLGAGAFSPDTLTVSFATHARVLWSNRDQSAGPYGTSGVTHHLVGDQGEFDSGNLLGGRNFAFTFPAAGTYLYHCSIHPTMVGAIILTP